MDSFKAVGGYTWARVQARQLGGENQGWDSILVRGADDDFLESSEYNFKLIAEGYGSTTGEVMQALSSDPTLVVLGGNVVRTRPGANDGFRPGVCGERPSTTTRACLPLSSRSERGSPARL